MQVDLTDDATPFTIADRLALLKDKEEEFRTRRIAAEERLVAALKFSKSEGSQTFTLEDEDGTTIKVELKAALNRKLDPGEWESIRDSVPEELRPTRTKEEVDLTALRKLQKEHPDTYLTVSRAVTCTPAKVSVSFK